MRKKAFTIPRPKSVKTETLNETGQLKCSNCRVIFPNYHSQCPECGSEEWIGYAEVNPYTRLPLESFLRMCGHALWLGATFLFILLLWQTDSSNAEENNFYILAALLALGIGILLSALYFGISEVILRILRLQRRLRAFHNNYRERIGSSTKTRTKKSWQRNRRRTVHSNRKRRKKV